MATLYELTTEYQTLLDLGDSPDPEDQQAFLDTLEGLDFEIGLKADAYAAVRSQLIGKKAAIDAEIDRLKAFSNAAGKSIERLEKSLYEAMTAMNKDVIKTDLHTFKIVKNGGKAPLVLDEQNVPDNYKKVVLEIDKSKIRQALEDGEQLPFARIGERGTHLSIK